MFYFIFIDKNVGCYLFEELGLDGFVVDDSGGDLP